MSERVRHSLRDLKARGHLYFSDGYRTKSSELGRFGFPILRVADILDGRIFPNLSDQVRPDFRRQIGEKLSQPDDIVLTTKGTVGRVARVPVGMIQFAYSPQVCFFRIAEAGVLDPGYLYYWLKGSDFRSQSDSLKGQTDMADYLSLGDIGALHITLCSVAEQREIGSLLGALDAKVLSNKQAAATAVELAERKYVASSSQPSWTEHRLADTATWLSGGTPSTTEPTYWGGHIPWISALSLKSPWIDSSERKITTAGATNGTRLVESGTIIFVVRGSSLDTEFRIGLTQAGVAFGQDCKALIPNRGIDPTLLFFAIRASSEKILSLVDHTGHGAGRLATDRIAELTVRLPPNPEMKEAAREMRSLASFSYKCQLENRTLVQLRDTLLPKLMSGELRIRDAERLVEDAT